MREIHQIAVSAVVVIILGYTGSRCETDVNECELNYVNCSGGECQNLEGGYICICQAEYCGIGCALRDPCVTDVPCRNGGSCEQRCTDTPGYVCNCPAGWAGDNCTMEALAENLDGTTDNSSAVLIGVGAAVLLAALLAAVGGALAAQARRKRATRGTYSPSGQEYCNPRAEMMHNALKPPPEERLI